MHRKLCVCDRLPSIRTRTRVVLLVHSFERKKTTSTGLLAARCLVGSQVLLRGDRTRPLPEQLWDPATQPLLLYPSGSAAPLESWARADRPITLLVPDGTWGQAVRVRLRVPALAQVPCVALPEAPAPELRIRRAPYPGHLSTIEALARALGILEGPEVQRQLEEVFRVLVERTLWSRGVLATDELESALPEGVRRHG